MKEVIALGYRPERTTADFIAAGTCEIWRVFLVRVPSGLIGRLCINLIWKRRSLDSTLAGRYWITGKYYEVAIDYT